MAGYVFKHQDGRTIKVVDFESVETLSVLLNNEWSLESDLPKVPKAPPGADRRKEPRFKTRFRIIIQSKDAVFRDYCEDISISGAKLEKAVPAGFVGEGCRIFIGSPNGRVNLEFNCEILKDTKGPATRVRFSAIRSEDVALLKSWIQAHATAGVAS